MADKKLESITFPGLPDRYVVKPDIADVTDLQTALNGKADTEDVYNGFVSENIQGSIASFDDGADDIPVKSLVAEIVPIQSGSGDPSPDNVRAISGWTEANITVASIRGDARAYNNADNGAVTGYFLNSDGTTTANAGLNITEYIPAKGGDSITIETGSYENPSICFYDSNHNYISGEKYNYRTPVTTTAPNGCAFIRFTYANIEVMFEVVAKVHTISFASAGTVYGGSIDVTTGVLTVDRIGVDLGELTWSRFMQDVYLFDTELADPAVSNSELISTIYKQTASTNWNNIQNNECRASGAHLRVRNDDYTTSASFKTAMSGVLVVYHIATPQTYQLTPTEVKTLLGNNNVWADTGDIDLTYRADLGLYLDKIINA